MHSALNRVQAVFGFFTTVALFVAGLAALSVLLYPTDGITSNVKVRDVKVYVPHPISIPFPVSSPHKSTINKPTNH